ncbi:SRPBCC family protein [Flavobacterium sp.]
MESQKISRSVVNILPKVNVSTAERIVMIAAGGYLLYKMLSKKEKSSSKMALGTGMLVRGMTGYCPAYHVMENLKQSNASNVTINVTCEINRPIFQVYAFWRNLENLPKFMTHLESVKTLDNVTSSWTAKGPIGIGTISWNAKITREEKGEFLSWKSLDGSTIENTGKVIFRPNGQATVINVTISYRAPLGTIGESTAKLLNPYFEKVLKNDIENLKTYLESGIQY